MTHHKNTTAYIFSLGTVVPNHSTQQSELAKRLIHALGLSGVQAERLEKIFKGSKIQKRHTVLEEFTTEKVMEGVFAGTTVDNSPGTWARNQHYMIHAPKLAKAASEKTLKNWNGESSQITHVISASCTGSYAPGIEFMLVDELNLSRSVQRYGINFMGCFGAFRGLALAKALIAENPDHRVLIVCTELCSLHFQSDSKIETYISNALFSDGAAGVIVGGNPKEGEVPLWSIEKTAAFACMDSQEEMTWEVTDTGHRMKLSRKVPTLIGSHIRDFAESLLPENINFSECDWAVHPGGKAILEAIEDGCDLDREQLTHSWEIMKEYGNMSSATFLFVLERFLSENPRKEWCAGFGMGPGLSFEGLLLQRTQDA